MYKDDNLPEDDVVTHNRATWSAWDTTVRVIAKTKIVDKILSFEPDVYRMSGKKWNTSSYSKTLL